MIARLVTLIILALVAGRASAQSLAWVRSFDFAGGHQEARSLCPAPDGGVMLLGSGVLPDSSSGIFVARVSPAGELLWVRSPQTGMQGFTCILPAPGGGYTVVGYVDAPTDSMEHAHDVALLRLDPEGNRLWERAVGTPFNDAPDVAIATADGGILTGGNTYLSLWDSREQFLRFDSEGNLLRATRIKRTLGFLKTMAELPNGDVLVVANGSVVLRLSAAGDSLEAYDAGNFPERQRWLYPEVATPTADGGIGVVGTYLWDTLGDLEPVRMEELAYVGLAPNGTIRSLRRGYGLAGLSFSRAGSDGSMLIAARYPGDGDTTWLRVIRMSQKGDILGKVSISYRPPYPEPKDLCELPNGDIVLVGYDVQPGEQGNIYVARFSRFVSGVPGSGVEMRGEMDLSEVGP